MGYCLYITRRKYHWDEDGPCITEDEWKALVEADPELEFKDRNNPLLATWNGKSEYPDPWFDYSEFVKKSKKRSVSRRACSTFSEFFRPGAAQARRLT